MVALVVNGMLPHWIQGSGWLFGPRRYKKRSGQSRAAGGFGNSQGRDAVQFIGPQRRSVCQEEVHDIVGYGRDCCEYGWNYSRI